MTDKINIKPIGLVYTPDAVILVFDDRDAKIARTWSAKCRATTPHPHVVLARAQFLDRGRVADYLDVGEAMDQADAVARNRL